MTGINTLTPAYGIGDVIEYRCFGGGLRTVRVTGRDDEIKNGRPGFDAVMIDSELPVWGYDSQVVRVVEGTWAERAHALIAAESPREVTAGEALMLGVSRENGYTAEEAAAMILKHRR